MPVDYITLEQARAAKGLRMVVVSGVPSPWSEAAKGIFHVKRIPWKAVRLDARDDAMAEWTHERSGPVAFFEEEPPRGGWAQILLLAERLAPQPPLLPAQALERAGALGIAHEICGEQGLIWARRLQAVHAGLRGEAGGFPEPVAHYLAGKYGYRAQEAQSYAGRVIELLEMLASLLRAEHGQGSRFYVGRSLSAIDIYSATAMAMFKPLPPEQCPMIEPIRQTLEFLDEPMLTALDPILLQHRDFIYRQFLELPLTL